MPHQCLQCESVFDDGTTEVLSGCPDCGGKKFQYLPESATTESATTESPPEDAAQAEARTTFVDPDHLSTPPPADHADKPDDDIILAAEDQPTDTASTESTPDVETLRSELTDQFGSIKILGRGEYELDLMELYDREEYIISLLEDGRYAIEVPERWED